jgi:hypothetical protein
MYAWTKLLIFLIILNLIFGYFELGRTQTIQQKADTTTSSVKTDSLRVTPNVINEEGEIELLEINIEAVIEKPRVAILPKRVEPELGEMEFVDRSFEKELKKAPDNTMIMDNRLFIPKKIENLKQKLVQKKEKLNKNK